MVNYKEFYINNKPKPGKTRCCEEEQNNSIDCNGILPQQQGEYLKIRNHLSEYQTDFDRNAVIVNLGIDKSLDTKFGFIWQDEENQRNLVFASEEDYHKYITSGNTKYILQELYQPQDGISYIYLDQTNGRFISFKNEETFNQWQETGDSSLIIQTWEFPDNSIYIGTEEPENKNLLWIDTSEEEIYITNEIASITTAIAELQKRVSILWNYKSAGVISSKVGDGTRMDIIHNNPDYEIPDATIEVIKENILSECQCSEDSDEFRRLYQEAIDAFEDTSEELKPTYEEGKEPTVPHIAIKMGTWEQMNNNKQNFVNGELIWSTGNSIGSDHNNKLYLYNNGVLYPIGGGTTSDGDNMTDEQFNEKFGEQFKTAIGSVESIGFVPIGSSDPKYTVKVNEYGNLIVYDNTLDNLADEPVSEGAYYDSGTKNTAGLLINSFYLGGDGDEYSYQSCSHNFVELSNVFLDEDDSNPQDINLNGFYLLYLGNGASRWQYLPLWGTIPAGGTFLIRGAQCSVMDTNTTKLKVKTFDMEWRDNNGELIKFDQDSAVFYLCYGEKSIESEKIVHKIYTKKQKTITGESGVQESTLKKIELIGQSDLTFDTPSGNVPYGYIDLITFSKNTIDDSSYPKEQNIYYLNKNDISQYLFRRWYMLDPVSQSNPEGIIEHNNQEFYTSTKISEGVISNYCDISEFTPKASFEKKTIGTTRSKFLETEPNTITCTFGIQATDNGSGATRGFCWNSVGYFDEYVRIRQKNSNNDWLIIESIKEEYSPEEYHQKCCISNNGQLPDSYRLPQCVYSNNVLRNVFYKDFVRKRWITSYGQTITTHKVLLSGIPSGEYEYQIFRSNKKYQDGYEINDINYKYQSKVKYFTVHSDSDINSEGFSFVQTTDQQGASWEEYEIWNLSAKVIAKAEQDNIIPHYNFTINTGDICYNGSRSNEWIDYYRGYEEALGDKEEMLTIGNNDLAPINMYDIGSGAESPWKINVNVGDYFYAIEFDITNPPFFYKGNLNNSQLSGDYFKIPSLYSFNYGEFHFVSLLSEIRTLKNRDFKKGTSTPQSVMKKSTVNAIFGIRDEYRRDSDGTYNSDNSKSSNIFDIEEYWVINDLLQWKGQSINRTDLNSDDFNYYNWIENDSYEIEVNSNTETYYGYRYHPGIVDKCSKCIFFIHEMPFNITSQSSYLDYLSGNNNSPRESAKAYLNRYHNYEYQRLFKLWDIRMAIGGHKHTVAMTRPVYDAPLGYNPITSTNKQLLQNSISNDSATTFEPSATFQPFIQITKQEFTDPSASNKWNYDNLKYYCKEYYYGGSGDLRSSNVDFHFDDNGKCIKEYTTQVDSRSLTKGSNTQYFTTDHPTLRVEIVDDVLNAPTYVMCQATGYKNKSNSDLAAYIIPWERFFVPVSQTNSGNAVQIQNQRAPYFTHYQFTKQGQGDNYNINVRMFKISQMYDPTVEVGYWDITSRDLYKKDTLEESRNCILENGYNNSPIIIGNDDNHYPETTVNISI